jgi:hypothetical protein
MDPRALDRFITDNGEEYTNMATSSVAMETLGSNVAKVWVGDKTILFSYGTPIAAWVRGNGEVRRYSVKDRLSVTSKRHLNQHGPRNWLTDGDHHEDVTAAELDRLLAGDDN